MHTTMKKHNFWSRPSPSSQVPQPLLISQLGNLTNQGPVFTPQMKLENSGAWNGACPPVPSWSACSEVLCQWPRRGAAFNRTHKVPNLRLCANTFYVQVCCGHCWRGDRHLLVSFLPPALHLPKRRLPLVNLAPGIQIKSTHCRVGFPWGESQASDKRGQP